MNEFMSEYAEMVIILFDFNRVYSSVFLYRIHIAHLMDTPYNLVELKWSMQFLILIGCHHKPELRI